MIVVLLESRGVHSALHDAPFARVSSQSFLVSSVVTLYFIQRRRNSTILTNGGIGTVGHKERDIFLDNIAHNTHDEHIATHLTNLLGSLGSILLGLSKSRRMQSYAVTSSLAWTILSTGFLPIHGFGALVTLRREYPGQQFAVPNGIVHDQDSQCT